MSPVVGGAGDLLQTGEKHRRAGLAGVEKTRRSLVRPQNRHTVSRASVERRNKNLVVVVVFFVFVLFVLLFFVLLVLLVLLFSDFERARADSRRAFLVEPSWPTLNNRWR